MIIVMIGIIIDEVDGNNINCDDIFDGDDNDDYNNSRRQFPRHRRLLARSIRSAISYHDLGGKKSLLGARNDEFDDMRLLVRHSVNSSANGL